MPSFCDPALMVDRRGPGKVATSISFVIGMSCLVTFFAVAFGASLLRDQLPRHLDTTTFQYGLTFLVAFWILASWLPPARLSRALRTAVLLPAGHAVLLAFAWPAWRALVPYLPTDGAATSLATEFPIAAVTAAACAAFIAFACLVARRRSGEWIHGFAMLALAELLLLGLWLPIACSASPGGVGEWWSETDPLVTNVWLVVVPPTIAALAFTVYALRWPGSLPKRRSLVVQALLVVMIVAVLARMTASARVMVLYTNFVPVLLSAAIVAMLSLVALGALTWWRAIAAQGALARRMKLVGTIIDDGDEPVAGVEISSWLRGPRPIQRAFAIVTSRGTLPVRGAQIVAPLPAATTQLRAGERIAVLRPGDSVVVAGHASASGDPFRTAAGPIADDLMVAPVEQTRHGFGHVALAMWRPCVAYLLIVTAVALPGLAALLADR